MGAVAGVTSSTSPGVRGQVNVGGAGAVDLPHTRGVADNDLRRTAGGGLQRRDAEALIERREKKGFAVSHQRLGCAVADIPQIQHIGQVSQAEALGLGGKAAAARNGNTASGLAPAARSTHGKFLFLSRFAMLK